MTEDLEFYSVMRSIRSIENSDVCILMLDATRGIESQDMNIFQLIQRNNKSLVVVVNKWDLVQDKSTKAIEFFKDAIYKRLAPFNDFPIVFASALTKQRIFKVLELAKDVYLNRKIRIGTTKLNEVMLPIIEAYPPQSIKGKYIKIKYCSQLPNTQIPSFVFYANCRSISRRTTVASWRTNCVRTGRCTAVLSTYSYVRSSHAQPFHLNGSGAVAAHGVRPEARTPTRGGSHGATLL